MKIVLVEESSGHDSSELTFQQEIVRIGRDRAQCEIAFDREKHPMVSRQHAELRHENERWILIDSNSSYGTFLNGRKIAEPQTVQVGSTIQIGVDGPLLIVLWLETGGAALASSKSPSAAPQVPVQPPPPPAAAAAPPVQPIPRQQQSVAAPIEQNEFPKPIVPPVPPPEVLEKIKMAQSPGAPRAVPPVAPNAPKKLETVPPVAEQAGAQKSFAAPPAQAPAPNVANVQFEFIGSRAAAPFQMTKERIWLGRDAGCDVRFDADQVMVSRRHAEITKENAALIVRDNNSFNGTLVNNQRISAPTPLSHGDEIQLGLGGPVLRLNAPHNANRAASRGAAAVNAQSSASPAPAEDVSPKTMILKGVAAPQITRDQTAQPQLVQQLAFGNKTELSIGRGAACDVKLDGLQISNRHARLVRSAGAVTIEDTNSTNGVFVGGQRVSRRTLAPDEAAQIGSFVVRVDQSGGNVQVFDTRAKTRVDCVRLTKSVKDRANGGAVRLLDEVSLVVQPNEFVGLLGSSGAGKSTLMDAMNGMRPASEGSVLINNLDLYQNLDQLKQTIGYVPQEDVIHRELSVEKTLYYVAKLRLSNDVSAAEINQIIDEVLDVTGLTERRSVPVRELSGGQRKRVSIAVELITKPSVIFLDEPTSGLDPATEEKIMKLFRQIAESGRTVILTTHAMENVRLFDKIAVLMRGKLVFYGKPEEALAFTGAKSFKELFDKLEEPVEKAARERGEAARADITDQVAEDWKRRFAQTSEYRRNIDEPLKKVAPAQKAGAAKKRRLGLLGGVRQWATLSRRYSQVLFRDKLTLLILLAQAPIIAVLTALVVDAGQPRDFVYFILSIVSIWFGTSLAAREIVRERAVYTRERMVNLGLFPYLASKLFVLGVIVGVQCLLLFAPLKIFDLLGVMEMPGEFFGVPQFWAMLLTAGVGVALGLLVSALVKTSEMATSLVPLILIPQILFSGLIGVPVGVSKIVGLAMPVTWSFDAIKRFSTLDTLEAEGSEGNARTRNVGYFKSIEQQNEQLVADAENNFAQYKKDSERKVNDYVNELRAGGNPPPLELDEPPAIGAASKINDGEVSRHVTFLHPWMNEVLNQLVLMLMLTILVITTLIVLRLRDIG